MQSILPPAVNELIDALARLPGVGPKSASRLAFYLLQQGRDDVTRLVQAVEGVTAALQPCTQCGLITDQELCPLCRDESRHEAQLCVVEEALDVVAFERAGVYKGRYHVLGGVLSPVEGVGPEQLRIAGLLDRVGKQNADVEVILAMNPSLEGEATADYLNDALKALPVSVSVTRIARGLPMGSDVEYADPTTLMRALEGRREITTTHI